VGGDLIALVRRPDGGIVAVNGSGAAPAAIEDAIRPYDPIPQRGPRSVTVPGAVAAWETLAALGARLGLRRAVEPSIATAADGVPVAGSLAAGIAEVADLLRANDAAATIFLPGGVGLARGAVLRQPAFARTLSAIAANGAAAVYEGDVGRAWVVALGALGSPMTTRDLADHRTEIADPIAGRYRDLEVVVAPPNSQGFVLLEILAAVEALGLDPDPVGPDAAALATVFRRASADRDRHLADPRRASVPIDELLSTANIERIAADVRAAPAGGLPAGAPSPRGGGDTVAVVAADREGWAVSLIQSLFGAFGSGVLDPATGVLFHNRGSGFSADPASSNRLEGGKRPLHTLMPVLALRAGALAAVAGTMGGGGQPQINAMSLLRLAGLEMPAGDALHAPRWLVGGMVVDAGRSVLEAEARVPAEALAAFDGAGFSVRQLEAFSEDVGHAQLIAASDAGFEVATDPRADGAALAG
jgi:gamma-glutamyltranspeptidase/glutathione hydrolase